MSARIAVLAALALLVPSCASRPDNSAVQVVETASTPVAVESTPDKPQCGGELCYEIVDNKMIIYNTPGEQSQMEANLEMPPDVASVKTELMIYDKVDSKKKIGSIEIKRDRTGVKSVTMKGKAIPKKE
jgi:hypothetical protein